MNEMINEDSVEDSPSIGDISKDTSIALADGYDAFVEKRDEIAWVMGMVSNEYA